VSPAPRLRSRSPPRPSHGRRRKIRRAARIPPVVART
jgi:hypothetical protein